MIHIEDVPMLRGRKSCELRVYFKCIRQEEVLTDTPLNSQGQDRSSVEHLFIVALHNVGRRRVMLLALENVHKHFGGIKAVSGLSLELGEKEIMGLIGPNGSGKTTVFNLITGVYRPDSGSILFNGEPLQGKETSEIVTKGIGRTFQSMAIFPNLTVLENMHVPIRRSGHEAKSRRAIELLELVGLSDLRNELARNLSYGQQKLLEFARASMLEPKIYLLDEPAAGVSPAMREKVKTHIMQMRDLGIAFIIVEHNMRFIMDICDRIVVLSEGLKIAEGRPEEIRADKKVLDAYLGG